VPGECAADGVVPYDQYCQDASDYQRECEVVDGQVTYKDNIFVNSVGFCVDTPACDIFAQAPCALVVGDGGVPLNGCEPTSPVHSYGLCRPTGAAGLGELCTPTIRCEPGLVCITKPGSSAGTCERYCGLGPNEGKAVCPLGEYCTPVLFGNDPSSECWDDPWTLSFGICRPDPRQDGGV